MAIAGHFGGVQTLLLLVLFYLVLIGPISIVLAFGRREGNLVAAANEERFTRKRHDPALPEQAVKYCLEVAGLSIDDLDYVVFYDKPFIKFERILMTYIATFPRSLPSFAKSMPVWMKEKLWIPR